MHGPSTYGQPAAHHPLANPAAGHAQHSQCNLVSLSSGFDVNDWPYTDLTPGQPAAHHPLANPATGHPQYSQCNLVSLSSGFDMTDEPYTAQTLHQPVRPASPAAPVPVANTCSTETRNGIKVHIRFYAIISVSGHVVNVETCKLGSVTLTFNLRLGLTLTVCRQ